MKRSCPFCSTRGRCSDCRDANRLSAARGRFKRGTLPRKVRCYRCLQMHPKGERYCWLAPEHDGYPYTLVKEVEL